MKSMGALEMGLAEEELQPLVDAWRSSNQNIVQFWWDVDRAVKEAVKMRISTETHGIRFIYRSGLLFIELPSGRRLFYAKPKIGENRFGGEVVTYESIAAADGRSVHAFPQAHGTSGLPRRSKYRRLL